jgi:hypothetical protein
MRKKKCKYLLLGSLWLWSGAEVTFAQASSQVEPESSRPSWQNSSQCLRWALFQLDQFQRHLNLDPKPAFEQLKIAIERLKALGAERVLENRRHFADLQSIIQLERDFLYFEGRHLLHKNAGESELRRVLGQLEKIGAPEEDRIWLYDRLKMDTQYLRSLRILWELHERKPQELKRELPTPPKFPRISTYDLEGCHEVAAVMDLAMKQIWRPSPQGLEDILLQLVERYESLGSMKVALDVMKLAPKDMRLQRLEQKKIQLEAKVAQEGDWLQQSGDLY